jgi:hypothetical protein
MVENLALTSIQSLLALWVLMALAWWCIYGIYAESSCRYY